MRDAPSYPSMKPLPKQYRELQEKKLMPKGMITKGDWEKKRFKTEFQKEK